MNPRLIALIGGLLAVALFAAGCGSDDDDSTDSASLTKAEFVKQGNAICAAGEDEIEAEFEKFAEENDFPEKKRPPQHLLDKAAEDFVIPGIAKQIEGVAALGAPEGEEEAFDAFVENAEAALEEAEEDPGLVTQEGNPLFSEVNKEGLALGLTVCGSE